MPNKPSPSSSAVVADALEALVVSSPLTPQPLPLPDDGGDADSKNARGKGESLGTALKPSVPPASAKSVGVKLAIGNSKLPPALSSGPTGDSEGDCCGCCCCCFTSTSCSSAPGDSESESSCLAWDWEGGVLCVPPEREQLEDMRLRVPCLVAS